MIYFTKSKNVVDLDYICAIGLATADVKGMYYYYDVFLTSGSQLRVYSDTEERILDCRNDLVSAWSGSAS